MGTPIHWFTSEIPAVATAKARSYELSPDLPWVIGNQSLEPSLLPLRVRISRKLNQEPEDDIESRLSGVGCRHFNHWPRRPPLRVVFGFTFLEGTSSAQLIFVCLPCQV